MDGYRTVITFDEVWKEVFCSFTEIFEYVPVLEFQMIETRAKLKDEYLERVYEMFPAFLENFKAFNRPSLNHRRLSTFSNLAYHPAYSIYDYLISITLNLNNVISNIFTASKTDYVYANEYMRREFREIIASGIHKHFSKYKKEDGTPADCQYFSKMLVGEFECIKPRPFIRKPEYSDKYKCIVDRDFSDENGVAVPILADLNYIGQYIPVIEFEGPNFRMFAPTKETITKFLNDYLPNCKDFKFSGRFNILGHDKEYSGSMLSATYFEEEYEWGMFIRAAVNELVHVIRYRLKGNFYQTTLKYNCTRVEITNDVFQILSHLNIENTFADCTPNPLTLRDICKVASDSFKFDDRGDIALLEINIPE